MKEYSSSYKDIYRCLYFSLNNQLICYSYCCLSVYFQCEGEEDEYQKKDQAFAAIKRRKKEIKSNLKKKESTEIWKKLADAYKMDIEVGMHIEATL